jgi:hypothetical protein
MSTHLARLQLSIAFIAHDKHSWLISSTCWPRLGRRATFRCRQRAGSITCRMDSTKDRWLPKSWLLHVNTSGCSRLHTRGRVIASLSMAVVEERQWQCSEDRRGSKHHGIIKCILESALGGKTLLQNLMFSRQASCRQGLSVRVEVSVRFRIDNPDQNIHHPSAIQGRQRVVRAEDCMNTYTVAKYISICINSKVGRHVDRYLLTGKLPRGLSF